MSKVDITIPDIGDAGEVTIIEILVSEGDTVAVDDSLITLESDKASMEVPATEAGTIASLTCKVGDSVDEGDVIGTLEAGGDDSGSDDGGSDDDASGSSGESDSAESDPDESGSEESGSDDSGTTASGDESSGGGGGGGGGKSIEVTVPDIGEAGDVEVIEVLVSEGDEVSEEQSLITLESDKASMEVPSPAAGTVESIKVKVGDSVDEGSLVLMLKTAGSDDASGGDKASGGDGSADKGGSSADAGSDAGAADKSDSGSKSSGGSTDGGAKKQSSNSGDSSSKSDKSKSAHDKNARIPDENIQKAHASPGVRRYAREHGADLAQVKGSGPKDRILKEDVTAFIKGKMESDGEGQGKAKAGPSEGTGIPPIPAVDFSKFGETETVELGRINKLSAANLHRAWLNLPLVTHHDEADVTDMEAFRKQLKNEAKEGDPKVTGLAFHMKALVACLKAFPKVNSSMSPDGESLIYKKYFHIGIAVDTPNGLVVPVFKDVDKKSINELADEMSDMSKRARDKKLKPNEMQGASMTISSLGGIGGTAFTPLVNPPEVAILGITRARMQPVWDGKDFVPRLMCPLDMSYDHRVIDGADAARFMAHYCRIIGDVKRLLL